MGVINSQPFTQTVGKRKLIIIVMLMEESEILFGQNPIQYI